jgi:hypothetical protein
MDSLISLLGKQQVLIVVVGKIKLCVKKKKKKKRRTIPSRRARMVPIPGEKVSRTTYVVNDTGRAGTFFHARTGGRSAAS